MTRPTALDCYYISVASCEKGLNAARKAEQSAHEEYEKARKALNEAEQGLREHLSAVRAVALRSFGLRYNDLGQIEEITE